MKLLYLFLGLALGCGTLLFLFGDFTPYVGEPDRDIWIIEPSKGWRLLMSIVVAMLFAASSTLVFVATSRVCSCFPIMRLFIVISAGLTGVVYIYGDFKTLFGDGMVFYELPCGIYRLLFSAADAAVLAVIAVTAAAILRAAFTECGLLDRAEPCSVPDKRC